MDVGGGGFLFFLNSLDKGQGTSKFIQFYTLENDELCKGDREVVIFKSQAKVNLQAFNIHTT